MFKCTGGDRYAPVGLQICCLLLQSWDCVHPWVVNCSPSSHSRQGMVGQALLFSLWS